MCAMDTIQENETGQIKVINQDSPSSLVRIFKYKGETYRKIMPNTPENREKIDARVADHIKRLTNNK